MVVKSVSGDSSNRENWDQIFKSLVKILQTKQDQLESLMKDRKIMTNLVENIHENWVSDVRNYEDQLSLMMKETETIKMMQLVETAKFNLFCGSKEKDRYLWKLKLVAEQTQDELNDFKAWFDLELQKESGKSENADDNSLEAQIRKLRLDYKKLATEKKCEVSDLLRENGFAWSQFNCIESEFTHKLKKKDEEITLANTKISSLISYQEELQVSNHEKDETISRLKAMVTEMEKNSTKKDEEISKLSQEIESLKKSSSFTPVLTRCKGSHGNTVRSQISSKQQKSVASASYEQVLLIRPSIDFDHLEQKDLDLLKQDIYNAQGSKCLKRKRLDKTPVSVSETPKLFSSIFRVPKLKSPSSGAI